jgi:hypothetical protein
MTATVEFDVFKPGNEATQQITCRPARMRVHGAVDHQCPRSYRPEGIRFDSLALKTQDVVPGFHMSSLIGGNNGIFPVSIILALSCGHQS